jgi:uncharacterized ParB-like nuclease family protein
MKPRRIDLKSLRLDGGTQPRENNNEDTILEYCEAMKAGATFPPIEVVQDGNDYWPWDGFHRIQAAMRAGVTVLDANIRTGTLEDARLLSAGANKDIRALPRTKRDKARCVTIAIESPLTNDWSDHKIAEHVGVSYNMVSEYRKRLSLNDSQPTHRTGRDGRTINTANIGKRKAEPKVVDEATDEPGLDEVTCERDYVSPPAKVVEVRRLLSRNAINTMMELLDAIQDHVNKPWPKISPLDLKRQIREFRTVFVRACGLE